jgi:hypothetical protein
VHSVKGTVAESDSQSHYSPKGKLCGCQVIGFHNSCCQPFVQVCPCSVFSVSVMFGVADCVRRLNCIYAIYYCYFCVLFFIFRETNHGGNHSSSYQSQFSLEHGMACSLRV